MSATAEALPRTAELEGLVDNAAENRLYGWAWNPAAPEERLVVELRMGEQVVARTTAERLREDLVRAGVGDGRPAFELPLRLEWSQRYRELNVIVRAADGSEAQLPMRARRGDIDPTGALSRVLEATATSHRQLREEIQRVADRIPRQDPEREAAIAALAQSQAALDARLETLTVWLTRMDERLAALASPASAAPRRGAEPWVWVLGAVLATAVACAALGTWMLRLG